VHILLSPCQGASASRVLGRAGGRSANLMATQCSRPYARRRDDAASGPQLRGGRRRARRRSGNRPRAAAPSSSPRTHGAIYRQYRGRRGKLIRSNAACASQETGVHVWDAELYGQARDGPGWRDHAGGRISGEDGRCSHESRSVHVAGYHAPRRGTLPAGDTAAASRRRAWRCSARRRVPAVKCMPGRAAVLHARGRTRSAELLKQLERRQSPRRRGECCSTGDAKP
jgi:hypothetical protein